MAVMKWDIKRGAELYRTVYDHRLKHWISTGSIKPGEVLVWRSGLSGYRKPEDLEELKPYFHQWEKSQLRIRKRRRLKKRVPPLKKEIKNILIIDDEKDMCSLLSETLSSRKYNVSVANTKKDGLTRFRRELPDLVFLDLKLPDGDGIKILPKIKKINPNVIVNIISAYGSEERKEEAKKKGAYSFIDKPFTDKDILKNIAKFKR